MPTIYDVNAIAFDPKGKITRLLTTSPFLTLKECDRQIDIWREDYKLIISWVQVKYDGGSTKTVHLNEYDWRRHIR